MDFTTWLAITNINRVCADQYICDEEEKPIQKRVTKRKRRNRKRKDKNRKRGCYD